MQSHVCENVEIFQAWETWRVSSVWPKTQTGRPIFGMGQNAGGAGLGLGLVGSVGLGLKLRLELGLESVLAVVPLFAPHYPSYCTNPYIPVPVQTVRPAVTACMQHPRLK